MDKNEIIRKFGEISVSIFAIGTALGIPKLYNLANEINELVKFIDTPWRSDTPVEPMWLLVRLVNGEYDFDYWRGNEWKNHSIDEIESWCDYVDPCIKAR